ncbi:MAG TPA: hypothetical protein VHE81_16090 [Lacipirellulaceae bacterium]|nr:hypothetical protein [Lacipirellulaceae bacterium]
MSAPAPTTDVSRAAYCIRPDEKTNHNMRVVGYLLKHPIEPPPL